MAFLDPILDPIIDPLSSIAGPVEPILNPIIDLVPGLDRQMAPPIVQRLPDTLRAFENKYSDPTVASYIATLPQPVARTLIEMDRERVARGQQPISRRETAQIAETAITGKPFTPPPERKATNLFGNFLADLRQLTQSIPKIPAAMVEEVRDLGRISEFEVNDPGDIFRLPGVRMLPGAFVAGNILGGEEGASPIELARHPLFTVLDVLPAARPVARAAKMTKYGQLAADLARQTSDSFLRTRVGQYLSDAFGGDARLLSRYEATQTVKLQQQFERFFERKIKPIDEDWQKLDPGRRVQLLDLMQTGQHVMADLSDFERSIIERVEQHNLEMADIGIDMGLLERIDGEIYDRATATRLLRARGKAYYARTIQEIHDAFRTGLDPADAAARAREAIQTPSLKRSEQLNLIEGYAHNLSHRYNIEPILDTLRDVRKKEATIEDVLNEFDQLVPLDELGQPGPSRKVISRQKQFITRTNKVRRLAKRYAQQEARAFARNVPARFRPVIERALEDRVRVAYGTPENIEVVSQALRERTFDRIPGFDPEEYRKWQRELSQTWQEMRDEGIEPVFIHHVTPGREAQLRYPRVLETIRSPSQVRARASDATPYVPDLTVALSHQALEWLARRGSEQFIDTIVTHFGKKLDDIRDELLPVARRRARGNPERVAYEFQRLLNQQYVEFSPTEFLTWKSPKLTALTPGETVWLPRSVRRNLERMHNPKQNAIQAALDPVMGVFRTAVLPLSPRWHLYNIFGGGVIVAAENPNAFRFTKNAIDILRKGETTIGGERLRLADLPDDMKFALGSSARIHQEFNYRSGVTLRRILDQVNAHRVADAADFAAKHGKRLIEWSFDANAFIDDMYRIMAYLEGYDKALTKGMSREAAEAAGMGLSRKVLQQWTDLTPIERSVMRYIFPFYGFMQHIVRFAFRYPVDHPFRAAVMGAFTRAELEDYGTTLPERFLNNFFLGEPDENGNVKTISIGGMNPFKDVANYLTLSGFVGSLNPVASVVLRQLGIDPQSGSPELYPNLVYDPEMGRLSVRTGNPVQQLIEATIPQSRVLFGLAQTGSEFKELMARDPDAAARLLRSQLGLPVIFRDINVFEEIAKSEMARSEAQWQAFNEALRTGIDEEALRFPALRERLEQVRALQQQGGLQEYMPVGGAPTPLELAQEAIVRMNTP
ncbi:MAG: hypothetical protein KatS3mg015_2926 [Fimbriimonadales bacterium]|nr:MAG: hypothetical protein KatS3mg015_2926 [Fimbriimonadales bacterium]